MIGESALLGGLSYLAVGRETTAGTYNTCTAYLPLISSSLVTTKDNKILEQIEKSRTYSQRTQQMKKVGGDIAFYVQPQLPAFAYLLQNAFVGTITSATATGETAGAGANSAMDHTFNIGDTYQAWSSLCLNQRKGPITAGKVFQYHGIRVNEVNFSAEINEALKCTMNLVGMDSTLNSNDVSAVLSQTATSELSFASGRLSFEDTPAALTTTSYVHVQSIDFGWSNNLKADNNSGRIGSDTLVVLPPGMATFSLRMKLRYDTTTAFDAMIASTKKSVQLEFLGPTMTGSSIRQRLRFTYPCVYVHNAGDPSIGGPNEILMSDVDLHVLRQNDTSSGYALQAILTNQMASLA